MSAQAKVARPVRKNSLVIVEKAYRGTIEEQYGHIVWLSRIMRAMGADTSLLLRGNAVLYAASRQPRMRLTLGTLSIEHLSHYESSVNELMAAGVDVYVHRPAAVRLAIHDRLIENVKPVHDHQLAELCAAHHHIWYW